MARSSLLKALYLASAELNFLEKKATGLQPTLKDGTHTSVGGISGDGDLVSGDRKETVEAAERVSLVEVNNASTSEDQLKVTDWPLLHGFSME